jgi:hypothetical protein
MSTIPASGPRPSDYPQTATLADLLPGDVIRLSRDGQDVGVLALSVPLAERSLINVHTTLLPHPLTMSTATRCHLVSAPRVAMVGCLLCRVRSPYPYDAADNGVPRVGICGLCDRKATDAVMAAASGEPTGQEPATA